MALHNFRSLAGIQVSGGVIANNALYRSAAPLSAIEDLAGASQRTGITGVVDLRDEAERDATPAFDTAHVVVKSVPIFDGSLEHLEWETLEELYTIMARSHGRELAAAVRATAELSSAGGVLIHCTAGKDRTGMVVALILGALGAPESAILDEYLLTSNLLGQNYLDDLVRLSGASEIPGDAAHRATHVSADMIRAGWDVVTLSGGPASYLEQHGVDSGTLQLLRRNLVMSA